MKINKMKILILAMVAGLIMATGCTASQTAKAAETAKVDTSWMFHDIVDAAFVKANIAVPMPENVILIDARPYKGKYVSGYIPGAVSIPFSQFDKNINLLPTDKNALLIYYCQGVKCKLSHKSAKKAEKLGYTNVKVYAKGYPEWISLKGNYGAFEAEHVAKLIADNNTVIVDARPLKTKFVKGHIPTAVSIPFSQFDTLKGKLPRDINTPIVFYCGGLKCRLSHKSAVKAIEMGYTNVKVFDKGYPEWKKMYGASKEAMQVTAGTVEGSIDIKRFKDILEKDPDCPGSLGMAISEAVEEAVSSDDTKYALGSVLNHVMIHQSIIGLEAKKQMEMTGDYPDVIIGSAGGGSNFAGLSSPFALDKINGKDIDIIAVEPSSCPTLTRGPFAYDFGDTVQMTPLLPMHTLGHNFVPAPIHAGGLRYHGMAPIVSQLVLDGIIRAESVQQMETFKAGFTFARSEGFISAPECNHAVAITIREALKAKEEGKEKTILFNWSGHGLVDLAAYESYLRGNLSDHELPQEQIDNALKDIEPLPKPNQAT